MNILYYETSDTLNHHGIKGQKWGKKNGPPYPLDPEDHSALEKKAGWRKSLDKSVKNSDNKSNKKSDKDTSCKELSDKQKKWLKIGAAATVTAVAALGTAYLYKSGKLNKIVAHGKDAIAGFSDKPKFKLKPDQGASIADDLAKVNPHFDINNQGYSHNCGNCAMAFEMRRRGIDVEALPNPTGVYTHTMGEFFNGFHDKTFCNPIVSKEIVDLKYSPMKGKLVQAAITQDMLKQYPNGSRGCLQIQHNKGGHFISWIIENNEVKFYDAQDPSRNTLKLFARYQPYKKSKGRLVLKNDSLKTTRLDDLSINSDIIGKMVGYSGKKNKASNYKTQIMRGDSFVSSNYLNDTAPIWKIQVWKLLQSIRNNK